MKIDRCRAAAAFAGYAALYDAADAKVRLKTEHTYRVAALCEHIGRSIGLAGEALDLAWLCGLLHDVGRFEQLRRYGTFDDSKSIDHAACSAEVLFVQGQIRAYTADPAEDALLRTAVATHSAYRLPAGLDARTAQYCNLLRDADKIDILRVNCDFPLEEIYNCTTAALRGAAVSPAVLADFYAEHAVPRTDKRTPVDNVVGHISLVYELVYPESRRIVRQQGYLDKMLAFASDNPETRAAFAGIRRQMAEFLARGDNAEPAAR